MNFAALPPEINSGLMYAGPGSGPMVAAATAWDGLAAELHSAVAAYQSTLFELTGPWLGPSSAAMTAAVTPYIVWLAATATQAEQTAGQAKAAVAAYEAAFALTVPPSVVAANRAQLLSLIATNVLGQNTPAIAATEVQYGEMWAQDGVAMNGYALTSAAAAEMEPFAPPPKTGNPAGMFGQAAVVDQALGNVGGTNAPGVPGQLVTALQGLAGPTGGPPGTPILPLQAEPVLGIFDWFGIIADELGVGVALPLSVLGVWLSGAAMYYAELDSREIFDAQDMLAGGQSTILDALEEMASAMGSTAFTEQPALSAGLGRAVSVGNLTVPPSWAAVAPEIRTAAYALPTSGAAAAPAGTLAGMGTAFSQMGMAGMAGSALAGAARSDGRKSATAGQSELSHSPPHPSEQEPPASAAPPKPAVISVKELAEGIRELGELRDSGLLTEAEFTEQKRRLLGR